VKVGEGGGEGERGENRRAQRRMSQRGGSGDGGVEGMLVACLLGAVAKAVEVWHRWWGRSKSFNHLNVDGGRWW